MTLNADEELNHVRSKIEIERKEHEEARQKKANRINAIFTHVAESREEAREERRNADPGEFESDKDAEKYFFAMISLLLTITVLMGLGLFTIGRFIVEHFRG